MPYILVAFALITAIVFARTALIRSRMEYLLIIRHGDFMRNLKINFLGKPVRGSNNHAEFSVELNGKLRRYSSIFHNRNLLAELGDEEIDKLCLKYIALRRASIGLGAIWVVAMACLPYFLA
jgi:hypothetical protein